ncbi:MAG: hypothetical protein DRQ62_03280 [Gammaproteobacteria bacterium]|nr:MAG: hypothetical protein DRQ62_03280 [Gammaproteobacteria bacterium]
MNNTQKLMAAVVAVFVMGFLMVGGSKDETNEHKEAAAMIRAVAAMQTMANRKCPIAVKKFTGTQVFYPTSTDTDHQTYVSLTWDAAKSDDKYSFEKADCTLHLTVGGISKLIIDGETLIEKEVKY